VTELLSEVEISPLVSAPPLRLSGERFTAVYRIVAATETDAAARARGICFEQTVEFPEAAIPHREIREQIVGRTVVLTPAGDGCWEAMIEFPVEVAGRELTQLLNVLFGNISLRPGIRLERFELPASLAGFYRGPRFGQRGLRELLGVADRPLLCTAVKPLGLSAVELAELAYKMALGGIDLIKDDHGMADQVFCRFEERVARCGEAVARANAVTGRRCLYLPQITAPFDELVERAVRARSAGAGGFMFCPGLAGLDAMRRLAGDEEIALPILSHPSFQGALSMRSTEGIAHGALYGQINRLAGADAAIFPSYGGRFSFTHDECRDLVAGCTADMGHMRPIFPVPAGGMSLDRAPELRRFYGQDVILLIGGDLHRHGPDLVANCRKFAALVEAAGC
jgi:ribulose-bisphosphate carboxylase large chain